MVLRRRNPLDDACDALFAGVLWLALGLVVVAFAVAVSPISLTVYCCLRAKKNRFYADIATGDAALTASALERLASALASESHAATAAATSADSSPGAEDDSDLCDCCGVAIASDFAPDGVRVRAVLDATRRCHGDTRVAAASLDVFAVVAAWGEKQAVAKETFERCGLLGAWLIAADAVVAAEPNSPLAMRVTLTAVAAASAAHARAAEAGPKFSLAVQHAIIVAAAQHKALFRAALESRATLSAELMAFVNQVLGTSVPPEVAASGASKDEPSVPYAISPSALHSNAWNAAGVNVIPATRTAMVAPLPVQPQFVVSVQK